MKVKISWLMVLGISSIHIGLADVPVTSVPNIEYVQPASQVGQVSPPTANTQAVFTATAKGSNSQAGLQNFSGAMQNYGTATAAAGVVTLSANADGYLQQIATHTGNMQTSNQNLSTLTQNLFNYWSAPANTSTLNTLSGYNNAGQLSSLFSQTQSLLLNTGGMLSFDFNPNSKFNSRNSNLLNNFNFYNTLSQNMKEASDYSVWSPAVNKAIFDVYTANPSMKVLEQAVNNPFASNGKWLADIQNASAPDLLRTLVIQTAIQNYMSYQSLKQQQDQMMLEATSIRMLAEVNQSLANNQDHSNEQFDRLIQILFELQKGSK